MTTETRYWCPRRNDYVKNLLPRPMVQMSLFGPNPDPEAEYQEMLSALFPIRTPTNPHPDLPNEQRFPRDRWRGR